jgi:hypothetical protein
MPARTLSRILLAHYSLTCVAGKDSGKKYSLGKTTERENKCFAGRKSW